MKLAISNIILVVFFIAFVVIISVSAKSIQKGKETALTTPDTFMEQLLESVGVIVEEPLETTTTTVVTTTSAEIVTTTTATNTATAATTTKTPPIDTTTKETLPPEVVIETTAKTTPSAVQVDLLTLVRNDMSLPANYSPRLKAVQGKYMLDERCSDEAIKMLNAAKNDGYDLMVISAFRSHKKQTLNFNAHKENLIAKGYSKKDAYTESARVIAIPGTSEHEMGLAMDIVESTYWNYHTDLIDDFDETEEYLWLIENSWKYGFINRYPKDKTDITDIIYEPWHYRYVGKEAARKMYEKNLTLEEYLGYKED